MPRNASPLAHFFTKFTLTRLYKGTTAASWALCHPRLGIGLKKINSNQRVPPTYTRRELVQSDLSPAQISWPMTESTLLESQFVSKTERLWSPNGVGQLVKQCWTLCWQLYDLQLWTNALKYCKCSLKTDVLKPWMYHLLWFRYGGAAQPCFQFGPAATPLRTVKNSTVM